MSFVSIGLPILGCLLLIVSSPKLASAANCTDADAACYTYSTEDSCNGKGSFNHFCQWDHIYDTCKCYEFAPIGSDCAKVTERAVCSSIVGCTWNFTSLACDKVYCEGWDAKKKVSTDVSSATVQQQQQHRRRKVVSSSSSSLAKSSRGAAAPHCDLLQCIQYLDGQCAPSFCSQQNLSTCLTLTHSPQLCWIEKDFACSSNSCFEFFDEESCNGTPYGCKWTVPLHFFPNQTGFYNKTGTCISRCENGYVNKEGCLLDPTCTFDHVSHKCMENPCNGKSYDQCVSPTCSWGPLPNRGGVASCNKAGYSCPWLWDSKNPCEADVNCVWSVGGKVCMPGGKF